MFSTDYVMVTNWDISGQLLQAQTIIQRILKLSTGENKIPLLVDNIYFDMFLYILSVNSELSVINTNN